MCGYVSILCPQNGVHFGGRTSGPRIRTPDPGFGPISGDFGPFQMMRPEIHPKLGPIWGHFGALSSTGIIKGPNPVYLGMYRIWPRLGYRWRYSGPQNVPFWVLKMAYRSSVPDDTSDHAFQLAHLIQGPRSSTSDLAFQMTHQVSRQLQHVSPSV